MGGMCDRTKLLELKKPRMVAEAAEKRKGLNIVLEILVFIALFVVCSIAQMIVATPVQLVLMYTDPDYLNAAMYGDIAGAVQRVFSGVREQALSPGGGHHCQCGSLCRPALAQ